MVHIAIVEDELAVQQLLQEYIQRYSKESGESFEVSVFSDGDEIVHNYQAKYDIIFLDIQMRRLNGMEAAEQIRAMDENVTLIFITNMANFAIRGYAVGALDFVLKPVPYFAFSQQLQKAVKQLQKNAKNYISLPVESGIVRLDIAKIYYIESYGHRLLFHTEKGDFTLNETMKNMEERLSPFRFFRCNNCYLVNLAHVESVQQNIVTVAGHALQISRPKKKAFMDTLASYIGGVVK